MRRLLLVIILFSFQPDFYAQEKVYTSNSNCYVNFSDKIFVHLNKNTFTSGEKIYYKAYIENFADSEIYRQSTIIYFEINDVTNKQVFSWRCNIKNKQACGNLFLPDSIKTGIYYFRAFTNFNRNLPSSFLFSKPILITQLSEKLTETIKNPVTNQLSNILFLPEGGSLVAGIASHLVFKFTNLVQPRPDTAVLKDSHNHIVAKVNVNSEGMGALTIVPEKGMQYCIQYGMPGTDSISVPLPEIMDSGILVNFKELSNENYLVEYKTNGSTTISQANSFRCELWAHGKNLFTQNIDFVTNKSSFSIKKEDLPNGLFRLILVNNKNEIICSQYYYFKNPRNEFNIRLSKEVYAHGEPITISLSTNAIVADKISASISINEKSEFSELQEDDLIYENYLMEAELENGPKVIYSDSASSDDLSIVWPLNCKSVFDPSMNIENTNVPQEINRYILTGKLKQKSNGQPLINKLVLASFVEKTSNFNYSFTNSDGVFTFYLDSVFDNRMLILQLAEKLNDAYDYDWHIDSKIVEGFKNSNYSELDLTSEQNQYLDRLRKSELVKRIYFPVEKNIKNNAAFTAPSNIYINPVYTIYPAEYQDLDNFSEIADNILQGVRFRKIHDDYRISMVMSENQEVKDENVLLFLNGVPFFNLNYIATLSSKDIERIEVFNSEFMYGDLNFNGIISIQTAKKIVEPSFFNNPVVFISNDVNGESEETINSISGEHLPNISQNVYWNPSITLDPGKDYSISFTAPDVTADYVITVNGIDSNGQPFSKTQNFKVQ